MQNKILLPTSNKLLQPKTIPPQIIGLKEEKAEALLCKHSKPLEEFTTGDQVMMKDKDRWRPATVINKTAHHQNDNRTQVY